MKKIYVFCAILALFCLVTDNLKGQVSDMNKYWIKENFSTFVKESDYHLTPLAYETYPNKVSLNAYYANIELAEGTCGIDTNVSKYHLRIRGLKDNGWASFTVPDADSVILYLRGKSHSRDRIIRVFRNEVLVETFTNIDEDTCVIFKDVVLSSDSLTYKITGGDSTSTKPVVIYGIEVTKFVNSGIIDADFNTQHISIYPNPVKDILTINNENGLSIKSMEIYNLNGQLITSYKGNNDNVINIMHLSKGVYLLKINTILYPQFLKFIKL
jgi:hypothetical protein